MARFNVADESKYGGQGGAGYFRLQNDHDTARVRFLLRGIEDAEGYAVHEVTINDKKRWVNCLREYGQPAHVCPFCAAGKYVNVKYFIPLYNIDEERTQTWERGKKFGAKLASMCTRYPNLVSHTFEIERNGKAGDTATTYEIYECSQEEGVSVEDFDEPNILGGVVLDKSSDELQFYLDHGSFPDAGESAPVRRRQPVDEVPFEPSRRTPRSRF